MNYEEAVKYISDIPKFTKKNTVSHTGKYLSALGVESHKMKIIHVAGTNGKGTVCAIISNVLVNSGKNTGLFISPHLVRINERIRINNEQISDEEFTEIFNVVKEKTDEMTEKGYAHPSFFEFLFLMGMYEFNKKDVEYVLLETGLGGRLDATNTFEKPYLTVITSIGMDHMEYLGDTIEKIAGEKAGIIKQGVKVVYWGEDKRVDDVIKKVSKDIGAETVKVTKENYEIIKKTDKSVDFSLLSGYYLKGTFSIPFISEYQVQNAAVAITAIEQLEEIREQSDKVKEGVSNVQWEGRMEIVRPGVIFDGAHNGPGIDEFVKTFDEYKCDGRKMILFSVVRDKDYDYMVAKISSTEVRKIFVTHIDSERGLETDVISGDFERCNCKADIIMIDNVKAALTAALEEKRDNDVLFCVGSLYLIGELKKCIEEL